jgi:NAD(P)-dependent dehydrogenase (short-subunit alcohol dehydrogenase family)
MKNRIALITGASCGIGAAVAKRFATEGAHVILVARNAKGLEETDDAIKKSGGSATLVPLDLANAAKIEVLAGVVSERFGKLDIVVGNAGMLGELTPLPHLDPKIWQQVIDINLTANYHLIRCFDLLLKNSGAPRAMFVTSGITKGVFPYWGAYAASKAALENLVVNYAAENAKTTLRANLIDPGVVQTRMRTAAMPGEDPSKHPLPEDITDIFVQLADVALKDTGKKFYV